MDFRSIVRTLELVDKSPRLARMVWGAISVTALFGVAALAQALRWW